MSHLHTVPVSDGLIGGGIALVAIDSFKLRHTLQQLVGWCVLLTGLYGGDLSAQARVPTLTDRVGQFKSELHVISKPEQTDEARSRAVTALFTKRFRQDFKDDQLRSYPTEHLSLLVDVAWSTLFWTREDEHADALSDILAELTRRGAALPDQRRDLYDGLVGARRFAQARQLEISDPSVTKEALPDFRVRADAVDGQPSMWVLSPTGRSAERQSVDLSKGRRVLVVSHPYCGFSRAAMTKIAADGKLAKRLATLALWVTPQDHGFAFNGIQEWNRAHPHTNVAIVHRAKEWPVEYFSETPVFYFFNEGRLVEKFFGWPKDGSNLPKLIAALDRLAPEGIANSSK